MSKRIELIVQVSSRSKKWNRKLEGKFIDLPQATLDKVLRVLGEPDKLSATQTAATPILRHKNGEHGNPNGFPECPLCEKKLRKKPRSARKLRKQAEAVVPRFRWSNPERKLHDKQDVQKVEDWASGKLREV